MSRKFCGSSASPILWITRADIGKAEMPAAPIIGFIFFFEKRLISFAKSTPPTVSNMNATRPSAIIRRVSFLMNLSACICVAMVMPSRSVMRFARTFCAVSESESSTPHSRSRLPNMRKPMSETLFGAMMPTIIVSIIGKSILVSLETFFAS